MTKAAIPQKNKKKAIFSFFAGAGFLDLGFEHSGYEIAFVNELSKSFLNAYKYSRTQLGLPNSRYGYYEGDMANLTKGKERKRLNQIINELRDEKTLIGFIGGPPCPDFSVAGKNKGRHGHHGKLSATYIKLINQQKPDFFLFENVKGLWKNKSHRIFYEELKLKLQKQGYVTTEKLINALEYGVAQDRDRIILVGFRRELLPLKVIDSNKKSRLDEDAFPWTDYIKYQREEIFSIYYKAKNLYEKKLNKKPRGIPADTTVDYWFKKNNVDKHPNSKHFFNPKVMARFMEIKEGDVSRKSFKRLHRWRYSPTVAYGNNEVHLHPVKNRRLSVAEALSLQSLPKEYAFPNTMTLSEMFKAIGNGVPYVAANGVANSINKFLDSL